MLGSVQFIISFCFLFISLLLFFYKGIHSPLKRSIFSVSVFISLVFFLVFLVADYFTGRGVTQGVIYYLNYGFEGVGLSEYFHIITILLLSLLFCLYFSLYIFSRQHDDKPEQVFVYLTLFLALFSLLSNPVSAKLKQIGQQKFTSTKAQKDTNFKQYYNTPVIEKTGTPKNLVLIYAEGLERTYFNKKEFPNLVPNLKQIDKNSISFTNITQDKFSHHTMGGMVASQCGIPLVSPSHANSMAGMDSYLASATCIGDLLAKKGYYLSYYGGADLSFGGKGKFYKTHGFDEIKGLKKLSNEKNKKYKNPWGLDDNIVLNLAYDRFIQLSQQQDKFGLFLLTLGTHHPTGHSSKRCKQKKENKMLSAVACSDKEIANFINRIRNSKYSKNTIIVVVSDHLALPNIASERLNKHQRRNLFLINIPRQKTKRINKKGSTLDIAPTILPYLGYEAKLGLGRNLIKSESNIEDINKNLNNWRPNLQQFWGFPKIEGGIKIKDKKLIINNSREFKVPVLIEFDKNLNTKLRFQFDLPEHLQLNQQLASLVEERKRFIMIEPCRQMNKIVTNKINYDGFCIIGGKGKNKNYHQKVKSGLSLSKDQIKKIIELK